MKLLLCVSALDDIRPFLQQSAPTLQANPTIPFVHSANILHHEVDIVVTGYGIFQTSYKMTKVLSQQKYHLALKVGFGNAYNDKIEAGDVLNIVNEKQGDFGTTIDGRWNDLYDLALMKPDDEPQQRGGFINLTNAYMNVFMPFKKVVGITVNHFSDRTEYIAKRDKYKADCETGDGLGFVYPCMYERQNFYQLCVIKKNLATGTGNMQLANEKMNEMLTTLIQKL